MGSQSRRDFFKTAGLLGGAIAGLNVKNAAASPKNILSDDRMGVLVDSTACIGCRRCEIACKEAHNLPVGPLEQYDDRSVLDVFRRPDTHALTVVNQFEEDPKAVDVKVQCMHCDHPACVSACIVGAFSKQENGAIIWDQSRCIGCRYCMVACPFQVPAFEYDKALQPRIMKCDFCYDRQMEGKLPACVEACPVEALVFGKKYDLLKEAHRRINENKGRYIDHVYGEHEKGGTSWLYIAGYEFSEIGFPKLDSEPAPGATEPLQHALFKFFVPPVSLYALLGGIMWLGKNNNKESELGE